MILPNKFTCSGVEWMMQEIDNLPDGSPDYGSFSLKLGLILLVKGLTNSVKENTFFHEFAHLVDEHHELGLRDILGEGKHECVMQIYGNAMQELFKQLLELQGAGVMDGGKRSARPERKRRVNITKVPKQKKTR